MDGADSTFTSLLVILLTLGEIYYAWTIRGKGIAGILFSLGGYALALFIIVEFLGPLTYNWAFAKTAENSAGSAAMELVGNTVEGVSPAFAAALDPSRAGEFDAAAEGDPNTAAVDPAAVAPAAAAPAAAAPAAAAPAMAAAPTVWTFPQRGGLTLMGNNLTLYWADGSGIAEELTAEQVGDGASACGWLLDPNGQPWRLVACGSSPVKVFDVSQVTGSESLPRPPAPPQPTPAPIPTPAPPSVRELAARCATAWLRFKTSTSWYDEDNPTANFPNGAMVQLMGDYGGWFGIGTNSFQIQSPDLGIPIQGIPKPLGEALRDYSGLNSEGWFQGSGTMCLDLQD